MNLTEKHIHLIGIGGTGLSAIARVLLERGCMVSGSDRSPSSLAQDLAAAGARVFTGHQAGNVSGADLVVRSSAVSDDNVEVQAAQAAGIPVLKRAQFLGHLLEKHQVIAVAGTHGKTTTTAMIAWILTRLRLDPSYIIGGTVKNLNNNAHAGRGSESGGAIFVIEADEYDRMFLGLNPDVIVLTYMEHDHPDCFPTMDDYRQAFTRFAHRLRPGGSLLASQDNAETRKLAHAARSHGVAARTYGATYSTNQNPGGAERFFSSSSPLRGGGQGERSLRGDYSAENIRSQSSSPRGGFDYDATWNTDDGDRVFLAHVSLQVPGEHNVRNSLAALSALHAAPGLKLTKDQFAQAAKALGEFQGTSRRFDVLGEAGGVIVVDDYAHHPTEIQATLAAARARYPGARIWAVWQPHTYSRTLSLLSDFTRSFKDADCVLVTEIYAARETPEQFNHFSAAQVVERIEHPDVSFVPTLDETVKTLLARLVPGDVLLVLSAGDADQVSARVLKHLKQA